jgi:hypothetical protein
MNSLTLRHAHTVPAILANAGENAATKFLEFFAARIRNLNTREAYTRTLNFWRGPSRTHINRCGKYTLNMDRNPPQPDYSFTRRAAPCARGLKSDPFSGTSLPYLGLSWESFLKLRKPS